MAKSYSNMSRSELEAALRSANGRLGALTRQVNANGKGKSNGKSGKVAWLNVVGYPCTSKGTAQYSSRLIARHLRDECGCNQAKGFRCRAHKKYDGIDYANKGSNKKADPAFASKVTA